MRSNVFSSIFIITFSLGMGASFSGSAQDSSKETRSYETGNFTELFLEGAYGVELIQGNTNSLEVSVSDSKAFDYLKVTNRNGLLHLHVDRKPFDFTRITLHVTFKDLERLRIFGSIKLETRGYLDLKDLDMLLEGGAKVRLNAIARQISVENKGGVLLELLGVTDVLNMRLAGTGHINAAEMKAGDVDFRIEGVGTGKVFATKTLKATIRGAGKISYLGNPDVREDIDGLGSVSAD
jgi:hypothetical protein